MIESEVSLFAGDVKLIRIQADRDQERLQAWSDKWLLELNPT